MNLNKKVAVLLAFYLIFLLTSCRKTQGYADSVSAEELSDEIESCLDDGTFLVAQEDYLDDYLTLPETVSDRRICFSADGNNINEYGIFHVDEGKSPELKQLLESYLKESLLQNRDFYNSYIPKETPKLANAEVRVFGNYVAYAILDSAERDLFFGKLEQVLRTSV